MKRRLLSAATFLGLGLSGWQIAGAQDAAEKPQKADSAVETAPKADPVEDSKPAATEKPVTGLVKPKKATKGEGDPAGESPEVGGRPAEKETDSKPITAAEIEIERKPFSNLLGLEMVWVDSEENEVGGFWVSKYEVTQEDYAAVALDFAERFPTLPGMPENPSKFKNGGAYPVEHVSWQDTLKFCLALSESEREAEDSVHPGDTFHYSLPSVEEWLIYSTGADSESLDPSNLEREPREVGTVGEASEIGLFDILGNVAEWCLNQYEPVLNSDTELVERFPALFSPKDNARAVVGATLLSAEKENPFLVAGTITRAAPTEPETAGNVGFRVVLKWGGSRSDEREEEDGEEKPETEESETESGSGESDQESSKKQPAD